MAAEFAHSHPGDSGPLAGRTRDGGKDPQCVPAVLDLSRERGDDAVLGALLDDRVNGLPIGRPLEVVEGDDQVDVLLAELVDDPLRPASRLEFDSNSIDTDPEIEMTHTVLYLLLRLSKSSDSVFRSSCPGAVASFAFTGA